MPIKPDENLDSINSSEPALSRRQFLYLAAGSVAGLTSACTKPESILKVQPGLTVARFPEKTEMILLTDRPPQLETPIHFLRQDLTPNEAFFVRWHHSGIPTSVDLRTFKLKVTGHVEKELNLSVDELKTKYEAHKIVSVNQCSGNSRSFYEPKVPGGQWGHGAVGNAAWTGVRLKDILSTAGIKIGAVQVSFAGLDEPPMYSMAKFIKALDVEHAMSEEVLVAYEMNGRQLPMLNGFPVRLVVPGWYATYWVKSLKEINVLPEKFKGFWMDKAYRIPTTKNANEEPEHLAKDTVPINRLSVRSLIIRPDFTDTLKAGVATEVEGIAFDRGTGITRVEVSTDGGKKWDAARIDDNSSGKFSFYRWRLQWTPKAPGMYRIMSRCFNGAGDGQTIEQWNRSGYMRNVIEHLDVQVMAT